MAKYMIFEYMFSFPHMNVRTTYITIYYFHQYLPFITLGINLNFYFLSSNHIAVLYPG